MRIEVFADNDRLDARAAQLIAEVVRTVPRPVLGLATGGTPTGVYRKLREAYRNREISFRNTVTFNLDEYVGLPAEHPQSYISYMNEHLFSHVDIPREHIHIPDGTAPDPLAECRRYDEALARAGRIDLQLLGLGHNGHIGFNEPGPTLNRNTHVVELSPTTREANARFFQSLDEVPRQAITMGIGSILHARRIVLLVKGEDKADIVARALTGPITTEVPASLLQTHPDLIVLLDAAAACRLDESRIAVIRADG
jgi:glucosamine-6-phosphate deaminase